MNTSYLRFCLPLLLLLAGLNLYGQDMATGDTIIGLIRNANSKELARKFNANIHLITPGSEGRYSRVQAEAIVREFFTKNPPKSVTLNHNGSSNDGSMFFIGSYKTSSANFRLYFLMKRVDGVFLIHQLRFETDD